MIYKDIADLEEDFLWLSEKCTLEYFTTYRLNNYDKDSFKKRLELSCDDTFTLNFYSDLLDKYNLQKTLWLNNTDETIFPMLALIPSVGLRIIIEKDVNNNFKTLGKDGLEIFKEFPKNTKYKSLMFNKVEEKVVSAKQMFKSIALNQKKYLFYAIVASISINILALGSSFYSMQVYDRVIPTNGISTLISLTIGVIIAIFLEMILKLSRASIIDQASKNMDVEYSHKIFERFLTIRNDALPKSVGTLSGQMQSYLSVRSFISTLSIFLFIDFPFAFMFLAVVILIGGIEIGLIILAFFIVASLIGMLFKSKIEKLTKDSSMASHKKLGLLIETVESSQKVKALGAKWHLMNKWSALTQDAIDDEIRIKHYTDISSFLSTFSQQISYVAIVATGAYIIANTTDLTMGALIAITILSNKVFAPIAQLPNLFVQWGRAKISVEDLDNIFKLEQDNENIQRPITYKLSTSTLKCENIKFEYNENMPILNVPKLLINKGEKIGILGVIGSGKSTLLKILSGLYKPTQGRMFLDDIEMQQISRDILSQTIGYLPQENKLFSGTLRDNLIFGLVNVTDEQILNVARLTGLISLISALPTGLDTIVPEGGDTVSGGQKQLIALTRMLIANNDVLLLDEPTASMDEGTERHLINVLKQNIKEEQTLIIVTHKPALLTLVDRIIILTPDGIAKDGTKEAVLQALAENNRKKLEANK